MRTQHAQQFSRRRFLGGLTLAGTVGLTGLYPRPIAAEPPPETPMITLFQPPGICTAPVDVAEALLRAEGFSEVRYVPAIPGVDSSRKLASGRGGFQLAGLRPRRQLALLRATAPRSEDDQVELPRRSSPRAPTGASSTS